MSIPPVIVLPLLADASGNCFLTLAFVTYGSAYRCRFLPSLIVRLSYRDTNRCFAKVRHNDYDRAPLDGLSNDDIDRFYEHHKSLSALLR